VPDGELALTLTPERQSVAVGRHWVVRTAVAAGVTGMANQVVELLTSELLSNAVLHGAAGRAIHLWFRAGEDDVVRVSVTDSLPARPVVLHPGLVAPSGRGMAIVEAMSNRWGVDDQHDGGKTVWFEIDLDQY
jgi:anti-sigma regulatory factor (Ser/Thr protein kinase)